MKNLIEFSRSKEFSIFMRGIENLEGAEQIIHGIFVDYHPWWKRMADAYMTTGVDFRFHRYPIVWLPDFDQSRDSQRGGPYDKDYLPEAWEYLCHGAEKDFRTPFIAKVYVTPTTSRTFAMRRSLEQYSRKAPFFTAVIDSPIGALAAPVEGGQEINATQQGTVGGYLQDQHGQRWGVTCAHVAQTANMAITLSDVNGATIPNAGTVAHTNFGQFVSQTQAGQCNPYAGSLASSVDAALFVPASTHKVLSTVQSIGTIDRIYDRVDLSSGSMVGMRGAVSGRADYEIGGYGVTTKLQLSGTSNFYCFTDLFEIFSPGSSSFLPSRIQQAIVPWPLQGDSGAWLCHGHSPGLYGYFGNLIGVRGPVGIATFAESLCDWAKSDHNLQLTPI